MTVLFRLKNTSCEYSIAMSFVNLKEKLEAHQKEKKKLKLTRILPKFLAKTYQEEDLRRAEIHLEYHKMMVRSLEYRVEEGREELERLRR